MRALIEKAKANRDDAEKTYDLFVKTKKSIPRAAPWISKARASSPIAGRTSVCKNRRHPSKALSI
jgi:hypothetical protein